MVGTIVFFVVLGLVCLGLLWFFIFKVKHLKTPDVFCVDGGVKTGKSLVTVMLAIKQYKKNCFKCRVRNWFVKRLVNPILKWREKPLKKINDMPMLYSNMPLNKVKYNDLTEDIILFNKRMPYKSVVLIDEASLLADSMLGMNSKKEMKERFDYVNEHLTLFIKLFGHITHGGSMFYNSQQIIDLHFAFKRCTSTYLFIAKNRKFPFFCLLDVREIVHTEDNDIINVYKDDSDKGQRPLFVRKKYYKYYDRYYLSKITDDLEIQVDYDVVKYVKGKDMKARHIVTFGNYKTIQEFNERMKDNA